MLIYEMMTGLPPWYTSDRFQLFSDICEAKLDFPWKMSTDARSLIKSLLQRKPSERLGSRGDASEVKSHAFFRAGGVNWKALEARKVTPPFRPRSIIVSIRCRFILVSETSRANLSKKPLGSV